MVDTVRFSPLDWTLSGTEPLYWEFTDKCIRNRTSCGSTARRDGPSTTVNHKIHGIRVETHSNEIKTVQASLPRLLFGDNGTLIKTEAQLRESFIVLDKLLAEIAHQGSKDRYFTRVDLVWQFKQDIQKLIQSHRSCRHPEIRKDPVIYPESIVWRGREIVCTIYDKAKEMHLKSNQVVRVQVQFKSKKLNRSFNGSFTEVEILNFGKCYSAYRRFLCQFCPKPITAPPSSVGMLIAYGQRNGCPELFDYWAQNRCQKQIQRTRRDIALLRPVFFNFDWTTILPEFTPPTAVDIPVPVDQKR